MYTIVMTSNKELITTVRTTLHQRETGVDVIRFLVPLEYEGNNLSEFVWVAKFTTPDNISHCKLLVLQEDLYNNKLDFRLDVDTDMTASAGSFELYLTFCQAKYGDNGEKDSNVFHTDPVKITISPVKETIFIPDKNLQAIDQLLLSIDDRINKLNATASSLNISKADDIEIIDGEIWLVYTDPETGEKIPVGDPISAASHVWTEM